MSYGVCRIALPVSLVCATDGGSACVNKQRIVRRLYILFQGEEKCRLLCTVLYSFVFIQTILGIVLSVILLRLGLLLGVNGSL